MDTVEVTLAAWQVTWTDKGDREGAYFASEEAARASCPDSGPPSWGAVTPIHVRPHPLATEVRWRVRGKLCPFGDGDLPSMSEAEQCMVNELQSDYGKPLVIENGWEIEGVVANSTDRGEAEAYVGAVVEEARDRELRRRAFLARPD